MRLESRIKALYYAWAMIALLSPAKTLDLSPVQRPFEHSFPVLLDHSQELVEVSRQLEAADLMRLMKISKSLATLNLRRFQEFETPFSRDNAKPAIFTFRGDTYVGFDVDTLQAEAVAFAQDHVRILSGLYGLLRPLDLIQPYRLEMGIKLGNARGKDLYAFWGNLITESIQAALGDQEDPCVVNLASNEYIKAVKRERLEARFVDCVFKEVRGSVAKVVGLSAKRARGMMARFICEHRVSRVEQLKEFGRAGYSFQPHASSNSVLEFHRAA